MFVIQSRFPDAVQRVARRSGAPLFRDRRQTPSS
jgi:hypothetical protein